MIGLELTFVPDLPGEKEFSDRASAQRAVNGLNRALKKVNERLAGWDVVFVAKTEVFPRGLCHVPYIVEMFNTPFADYVVDEPDFIDALQAVFDCARYLSRHDPRLPNLLPRIRRRGVHHCAGGGHIHVSTNGLFHNSTTFLSNLAAFERNLYIDFANRPYIRWLFAEWFDVDENSEVVYTRDKIPRRASGNEVYAEARLGTSIRPRFAQKYKTGYPTYEFRFFDAQTSAQDVARDVRFLRRWIAYHTNLAEKGIKVPFTLTRAKFDRYANEHTAWDEVSKFLTEIGLKPDNYRGAFESNYLLRIRHGQMT